MEGPFQEWLEGMRGQEGFRPCYAYIPALDLFAVVTEDVSYRARFINTWLSALLRPHEDTLIGVQVRYASFFMKRTGELLDLGEEEPLPLAKLLSVVELAGMSDGCSVKFPWGAPAFLSGLPDHLAMLPSGTWRAIADRPAGS